MTSQEDGVLWWQGFLVNSVILMRGAHLHELRGLEGPSLLAGGDGGWSFSSWRDFSPHRCVLGHGVSRCQPHNQGRVGQCCSTSTHLLARLRDLDKELLFQSKATLNLYFNHIKFYSSFNGRWGGGGRATRVTTLSTSSSSRDWQEIKCSGFMELETADLFSSRRFCLGYSFGSICLKRKIFFGKNGLSLIFRILLRFKFHLMVMVDS